jgi:iron complex outermembrane receptor protein
VKKKLLLVCVFCALCSFVYAEEDDEDVFELPEAEVTADRDTSDRITREEMDRDGSQDLWEAVRYIPGVILSGGGRRGDSNFSVRGYGADSVPVFVDGILMANPYRGEGDSARILAGDLESIEIEKGYSTELLGANAIGGVILLQTAKPKDTLEALNRTVVGLDGIGRFADFSNVFSLGTRQRFFYGKAVVQYRNADHWRLPESFEPTENNPQGKGDRLWSDSRDLKVTLTAGLTPLSALDIWFTYVYQDADKGYSPPDVKTRDYEIWNWPVWKRQSASVNGAFTPGPVVLNFLFYFDKYDNRLDEYYNWNAYELGIHAPHSDYDEYSLGGRVSGGWDINSWNNLRLAVTYKKEDHRGLRGSLWDEAELTGEMHVNEDTWSLGTEYEMNPWTPLTIKAGFGFDMLFPNEYWNEENEYLKLLDADYFIVKTRSMFLYTWQAGVFFKVPAGNVFSQNHEIRFTYARKNHFPTMAQRYSTRFGRTLPNPNLGPEIANHFELGYRGYFGGKSGSNIEFILDAAFYYSIINNKIVTIQLGNPYHPSALTDYARNLDKTSFWGFEMSPEFIIQDRLNLGLAFSVNNYILNHSQLAVKVIPYYPRITLNSYAVIKLFKFVSVIPRIEFISGRYVDSIGNAELDPYALFHLKVSADLGRRVTIAASAENILDTYYEMRQYSPMAGRSFTFTLDLRY